MELSVREGMKNLEHDTLKVKATIAAATPDIPIPVYEDVDDKLDDILDLIADIMELLDGI